MSQIKILNLIIASDNEPYYAGLIKQWERYMNIHPNIKSWFIRHNPNLEQPYLFEKNTLWMRGIEDGYQIYNKTLNALRICLSDPQYKDVSYVIRTNLSSFYIWDRVLQSLENAPKTRYITGRIITQRDNVPYPSGCGMIMSRDVAEIWASYEGNLQSIYLSDDWAFGYTLKTFGLTITPALCYMIPDEETFMNFENVILDKLTPEYYHMRVKAGTEEHRKTYEQKHYSFLVDKFYPTSI